VKTGVIRHYDSAKKFGFIRGDDGEDYFFHGGSLSPRMQEIKLLTYSRDNVYYIISLTGKLFFVLCDYSFRRNRFGEFHKKRQKPHYKNTVD